MWYCHSFLQHRVCYLRNKFKRNGCSSSFTWMQGLSAPFQHMQEPFKYIKPCQKARLSFLAEKPGAWNLKPMLCEKNGTIQFDIRVSLRRPVGSWPVWKLLGATIRGYPKSYICHHLRGLDDGGVTYSETTCGWVVLHWQVLSLWNKLLSLQVCELW